MLFTKTAIPQTLELLKNIQSLDLFKNLRIVGGTGLALQIGHRMSDDIDLFGDIEDGHQTILDELKKLGTISILKRTSNIHIFLINEVKVDIVNYSYPWLKPAIIKQNIKMADIEDIAAMKMGAITGHGTKKDFIDLYFLLQKFTLDEMLHLYEKKFNDGSIFLVLKSLCYFEDAESDPMPKMFKEISWDNVKQKIIEELRSKN
jgi:Nucleotidyl transferase AbiEii toxin, Type IV TA system